MKPSTLLWCAAMLAACSSFTAPTPAETTRLAEARRLLEERPRDALMITDELLAQNPKLREARLVAAEGGYRLAKMGGKMNDLLLQDSVRDFQRALEGVEENGEPRAFRMLADCYFELGDFEHASQAALRAAQGFTALKTTSGNRHATEANLMAARCDLHLFVAARKAEVATGKPDTRGFVPVTPSTAELASRAINLFAGVRAEYPGEATTQIAAIDQWLGQDGEGTQELERGVRETPQESAIHDAYIAWMVRVGQYDALIGAYGRFVKENPGATILRWHQGRAVYTRADKLRNEGNYQGALASYGKARAIFAEYHAIVPGHAAATNQWLALCELSLARISLDMGNLENAQTHLFAADDRTPLTTTYDDGKPQLPDSFGSHYTALVFAISRALSESGENALQKTLAFNEEVLRRHPDRWGFVYNNAGLAARDRGVQVSKQGEREAAMQLWERSYAHYQKAVELSPDDARIVNDCGLMLVYHLNRDFERARQLFDRAIAIGQAQLDALPREEPLREGATPDQRTADERDARKRDREALEEAVGDAYQNIAVMLKEHMKQPFEAWRSFCENAVRYYPYERREAASLLRKKGETEVAAMQRSAAGPKAAAQGAADVLAKATPSVTAKVGNRDFDGALTVLDGIAKECRDYAPFQHLRGEITLQLARASRDSGRKGADLLFQDAVTALQRGVELDGDPGRPRQLLAEAMFETGDLEGATKTASELLLHLQSQGGAKQDELLAAHTLRANAASRAYAAKKQAGSNDEELLAAAQTSFRLLEQNDRLGADTCTLWSTTEQWAGAPAEAVNVFVRASTRHPDDQALLGALVTTAATQQQLPLAIEALLPRTDATSLFYLGRARYLLAGAEREGGDNTRAQQTLDAARDSFARSMQQNPDYRDSCEQWLAMCLGKKGNIALSSDDVANAEAWLLEAVRSRPDRIGEDLGQNETTKIGIMRVADVHYRAKNLAKAEAIYRIAADAANSDLELLNNAGLFARDQGSELERAGKREEAKAMFEQSYKVYQRAQQLDPQSVRLRNDCALIAIYHLEGDWPQSKQLLDTAIADGEKALRDNPPGDANERQQLDEAVGDCYENLALWHLKHSQDAAAAKAAALQSQQHYPGEKRGGARRHLLAAERLLQGK
jgi:tetratricopeptide (TPR) repeat protein